MRRSYFLLLAVAVVLALGAPADRVTRESAACTYINAWDYNNVLCTDAYIRIDSIAQDEVSDGPCNSEWFATRYNVTIGSTCGGTDGACFGPSTTTLVSGNNLSGTYKVFSRSSYCLVLCACQ